MSCWTNLIESPFEEEADAQVSAFWGNWLHVERYFISNQLNSSSIRDTKVALDQFPHVEKCLQEMLDLLAQERPRFIACLHDRAPVLPPCYSFLLGVSPLWDTFGNSDNDSEEDSFSSDCSDGSLIIMKIIQFTKPNIPQNSSAVLLRFLAAFFSPTVDADSGERSILHYKKQMIAIPLLDLIKRLNDELNLMGPWPEFASDSSTFPKGINRRSSSPHSVISSESHGPAIEYELQIASLRPVSKEKRDIIPPFVALLTVLCKKIEKIPSTATFFVNSDRANSRSAVLFVLLEALLPFLHPSVLLDLAPSCREVVLSSVFDAFAALVRTCDSLVQGFLIDDRRILQLVTHGIRHAFLTLCTIPSREDAPFLLEYICSAFSFLDMTFLAAPSVAASWGLHLRFFTHIVLGDCVSALLRTGDTQTYAHVVSVLGVVMHRHVLQSETLRSEVAEMLLVDVDTDFTSSAVKSPPCEGDSNSTKTKGGSLNTRSLLKTRIIPRLFSANEHAVNSSLFLLQQLVEQCPLQVLEQVLDLTDPFIIKVPLQFREGVLNEKEGVDSGNCDSFSMNVLQDKKQLLIKTSEFLPQVDISALFAPAFHIDSETSSVSSNFSGALLEATVAKLLYIESNMADTMAAIEHHQPRVSDDPNNTDLTKNSVESLSSLFYAPSVINSHFILELSRLLSTCLDRPGSTLSAVTELFCSLILVPDYRVFYTLVSPEMDSPLVQALQLITFQLEKQLEADEKLKKIYSTYLARSYTSGACVDELLKDCTTEEKEFVQRCLCLERFMRRLNCSADALKNSVQFMELGL